MKTFKFEQKKIPKKLDYSIRAKLFLLTFKKNMKNISLKKIALVAIPALVLVVIVGKNISTNVAEINKLASIDPVEVRAQELLDISRKRVTLLNHKKRQQILAFNTLKEISK